jgi:hypothetical protein
MSQQTPIKDGAPYFNEEHASRRLFFNYGYKWIEVANTAGYTKDALGLTVPVGKFLKDYDPPSPDILFTELKILNGPSKLHTDGKACYTASVKILLPNKKHYNYFQSMIGNVLKFYDEKGAIYIGSVQDQPKVERTLSRSTFDPWRQLESEGMYIVSVQLKLVKKSVVDEEFKVEYTDIYIYNTKVITINEYVGDSVTLNFTVLNKTESFQVPDVYWGGEPGRNVIVTNMIEELLRKGYGEKYTFKRLKDNAFALASIEDEEYGDIILTVDVLPSATNGAVTTEAGMHWAEPFIASLAGKGVITQQDANGNKVYTFNPSGFVTRAQMATFLNKAKKFVERVVKR